MWMKEARGTFARMVVVLWLGLVGAVGSAHAQCPHCNPASAHSLEMCRIGNPPQEFYRSGQGGVSVGSMLAQACSLYAAEHSSQAYAAVWQSCTPAIPAPDPQNFGSTWGSFSVDGTLLMIERSTGKVVSTASGGWSLATCSCWDSVKPYSASLGNDGLCYCKGEEVWDAARQTCVPRPAEPLRIELEGDTVTRAAPLGPSLAQRAVVRRAGAPVAGVAVSIALQGQGTLQGTTDGAGQFHFTYVPPRGKARDTVTGNCTGCENTAMRPIEVTAPGVEMCPAEAGTLVGNPILAATGEKVHFEQDFADGAAHPLHFGRSYRSQGGWRHTWEGRIGLGSEARVVELGDGSIAVFTLRQGRWVSDNGDTLAPHAAGLTYRKAREDQRWEFDAGGRLVALVQANGWAMSLGYDAAGRLQRVTNAFGRSLVFTHGEGGKLQSVQVPGGQLIRYAWAGANLLGVTHADNTTRSYHYEDARHANALTGITDEAGQRIATYTYDEAGRAVSTGVPGLAGHSIAYGQAVPASSALQGSLVAGTVPGQAQAAPSRSSVQVTGPLGGVRSLEYAGGMGRTGLQASNGPGDGVGWATRVLGADLLPREQADFLGVVTRYSREDRGLVTVKEEVAGRPEARTTQTQWHPQFHVPVLVGEPGRTTAYTYDGQGNRLSEEVTDTQGGQVRRRSWTYNGQRLVATVTDARGAVWRFAYDSDGNVADVAGPLGRTTSFTHDAAGRVLTQKDAGGLATVYVYDARGRVVSVSRGGESWRFSYAANGLLVAAALPNGHAVTYAHDTAGRLTGLQDNRGTVVRYTLDAMGNPLREEVSDPLGNIAQVTARYVDQFNRVTARIGADGKASQLGYDANGELVSEIDPLGQATRHTLDALGRTVATAFADGASAAQAWNAQDEVTQVVDPKGVKTTYSVNSFGEVTREASPDIGEVVYGRDAGGQVIAVTGAKGNTVRIARDALGRPVEVDLGAGRVTRYAYDVDGNVVRIDDASGSTVLGRDAQGRVLAKEQTVNGEGTDSSHLQAGFARENGELAALEVPSGLKLLYRRVAGRIVAIDVQLPGRNKPVVNFLRNLVYTPLGQPKAWSWSNGDAASRTFDRDGRMTGNEFAAYAYDAAGRITDVTQNLWATSPAAGTGSLYTTPMSWTAAYDNRNRITGFSRAGSQTRYTYDANGNRLTGVETVTSDVDLDGEFDASDLTRGTARVLEVAADSNRLTGFTQTLTRVRDGQTKSVVVTPVNYTLDENGSMTSDGLRAFEYDGANRLAKVRIGQGEEAASVTYLHSGLGQRVFKSEVMVDQTAPSEAELGVDFVAWLKQRFGWLFARAQASASVGTSYLYGDGEIPGYALLGEYNNGSALGKGRTEYIWLPVENRLPVPVGMFRGGKLYAIHSDHLATPRLMTDEAGKPVWQWPYSAFGDNKPTGVLAATQNPRKAMTDAPVMLRATKPAEVLNLRYPGQYFDEETGTNYNALRDSYDAVVGRYRQADPVGMRGGVNRFGYVDAMPLGATDPWGLEKLILLPANDINYPAALAAPDVPGLLTVYAHGNPDKVAGMNAADLADRLVNAGLWKQGMPIKLDACRTGEGETNIARQLSTILNTNVTAPNARTLTFGKHDLGPWHSLNIPGTERTIPFWRGTWVEYPAVPRK